MKPKLTEELQEKFCEELRKGKTIIGACGAVNLGRTTYYEWREKGENAKTKTKYKCFVEAVDNAMDNGQSKVEDVIWQSIMDGNVNTAKWYLERRDRDNWGKPDYYTQMPNDLEEFVDSEEEDRIFKEIGKDES